MTTDVAQVTSAYLTDERGHPDGTPWLMLNMISSVDGAIAVDGLSGALGNDADLAVFKTLRSLADVVLVAAGTVRSETYRVPSVSDELARGRTLRGQAKLPTVAVVTRSLSLDLEGPLFGSSDYRPVVVTVADSPADRRAEVADVADVITAGTGDVDLRRAIDQLGERYGSTVLAEGGPTLNGQLAHEDLLDELCLTVSPLLVGGTVGRLVSDGPVHEPRAFRVDRALGAGGLLFTRYLRDR